MLNPLRFVLFVYSYLDTLIYSVNVNYKYSKDIRYAYLGITKTSFSVIKESEVMNEGIPLRNYNDSGTKVLSATLNHSLPTQQIEFLFFLYFDSSAASPLAPFEAGSTSDEITFKNTKAYLLRVPSSDLKDIDMLDGQNKDIIQKVIKKANKIFSIDNLVCDRKQLDTLFNDKQRSIEIRSYGLHGEKNFLNFFEGYLYGRDRRVVNEAPFYNQGLVVSLEMFIGNDGVELDRINVAPETIELRVGSKDTTYNIVNCGYHLQKFDDVGTNCLFKSLYSFFSLGDSSLHIDDAFKELLKTVEDEKAKENGKSGSGQDPTGAQVQNNGLGIGRWWYVIYVAILILFLGGCFGIYRYIKNKKCSRRKKKNADRKNRVH